MKTYETMAQDALRRIHSLEQKKAARQRTARRLLLPAICIGVAGAAALGWHSAGRLQPAQANSTPAVSESPAGTDSADATAAGDRIIVGHLPAGAPADNSRKFVLHTEDEMTVQKTQYFGINTRPQVPADLTADPEAGTDDTMRIFRPQWRHRRGILRCGCTKLLERRLYAQRQLGMLPRRQPRGTDRHRQLELHRRRRGGADLLH